MAETKSGESLNLDNLIFLDEKRVGEIFDHIYQNTFIKILLDNENFFLEVFDIIVPQYFDDYQRVIIDKIIKYYSKNSVSPDFSDLKRVIRTEEKDLQKEHLIGLVDKISEIKVKSDKPIIDTAMTFFKKRAMADALYKMAEKWSKDDFDGMVQPLTNALKAGQKKDGGLDYIKDVRKTLGDDVRKVVEIMDGLDQEIGGGMSENELFCVITPTGGGKSMFLVSSAAHSIKMALERKIKRNVLYISLELTEKYVARRFHSAFTGILLKEQKFFPDAIEEYVEEFLGENGLCHLEIQQFPTRKLSVPMLRAYLDNLARNKGFKPDIIYLDYADIMNSSGYDKDHRLALQILYQEIRSISSEYHVPILTASQSNRASSKLDLITVDNIAESYGKAAELDILISISNGAETKELDAFGKPMTMKQLKRATMGILKNRMGADGFYKDMHFDTSRVDIRIIDHDNFKPQKNDVENNLKDFSAKTSNQTANLSINEILARQNKENDSEK